MNEARRRIPSSAHASSTSTGEFSEKSKHATGRTGMMRSHKRPSSTSSSTFLTLLAVFLFCIIVFLYKGPPSGPKTVVGTPMIRSVSQPDFKNKTIDVVRPVDDDDEEDTRSLALLYPPGLMGGYRNQVIRFLALVVYTLRSDVPHLLLPSLMWVTQVVIDEKEVWVPIPFDLLFDVDHWNRFSEVLPTLVDYNPYVAYDCWTKLSDEDIATHKNISLLAREVLKRGLLTPIANRSRAFATREETGNTRRVDFYDKVKDCQNPRVFGGGKAQGRLWQLYSRIQQVRQQDSNSTNNVTAFPFDADANVLKALQPKKLWRDLAMSCAANKISATHAPSYVALHARIELEMMAHPCGRRMERNLTKILERVQDLIVNNVEQEGDAIGGVFVAVSRSGIEVHEGSFYDRYKAYADENLATLNRVTGSGESDGTGLKRADDGTLAVFECGKRLMDAYYKEHPHSIDYGSLLQSIVNFYIATESAAFVGVRGSSYSTDIWTTRYHQGKGSSNFEYTTDGIFPIENGGLPPPHINCNSKDSPTQHQQQQQQE